MSDKHRALAIVVMLAALVLSSVVGMAIGMSVGSDQLASTAVILGAFVLSGIVVAVVNRRFKRERG